MPGAVLVPALRVLTPRKSRTAGPSIGEACQIARLSDTQIDKKTLESPLDCKEIQPVHPKGDQFWVFIRRTDVEAETPILWPSDAKN